MSETTFDLIVIGAGPGGYVAAIRASQLGMKVACVEKEDALGGTCLRVGCIPSKALLEASEHFHMAKDGLGRFGVKVGSVELDLPAMLAHKDNVVKANTKGIDGLFKKGKIARFLGHGRLAGNGKVTVESAGKAAETLTAKNILIATGSKVAMLPDVKPDGKVIGTSTEAIAYPEVPKHLVVIGAGAIGLELGSVWSRLGAKVTVLEYLPRILPGMDTEIAAEAQKILAKQGLEFRLGTRVKSAKVVGDGAVVECEGQEPIQCDRVLVSVGRVPNTENLGLESVGIKPDGRGRISVDEKFATSVPGIYAIGDVIPGVMLAHKAEEEGMACVEGLAGKYGHVNYNAIPNVVYTHPEIASVGRTEEELKSDGIAYKKGSFPFMANGRARALAQIDGRIKILADAKTDRILGVHILGPRAGDLIAEAVVAMEFGASAEDIARSSHAHPTLAEVMKEAALNVDGRSIHI
ncbi:MAG: dihydrolipoamide dehydrogenase [Fibrobacteres bacterium]|nr:dihydrolipoamide dehydrogenase [Fibrobacterota bacterium]